MGGGTWTTKDFATYATTTHKILNHRGVVTNVHSQQDNFLRSDIHPDMNIYGKTRECVDSAEHPNTVPVIIALDVTGSMGDMAIKVANNLNPIMEDIFRKVKDVEFCVMAIGDFLFDDRPIQVSQFESDIRIAKNVDDIYFEGCGGGNGSESYSAAWYYALNCVKLDCHKRGKKGLIITIGDEMLDDRLPSDKIARHIGVADETQYSEKLYPKVAEKFDVYHISINDWSFNRRKSAVMESWSVLGERHIVSDLDSLPDYIKNIVVNHAENQSVYIGYDTSDTPDNTVAIKW